MWRSRGGLTEERRNRKTDPSGLVRHPIHVDCVDRVVCRHVARDRDPAAHDSCLVVGRYDDDDCFDAHDPTSTNT